MKKKALVLAVVAPIAACADAPWEAVGAGSPGESTGVVRQRVESPSELFPHVLAGPTLVQWAVADTSSGSSAVHYEYGVRLRTEASGTVSVRFAGCSGDTVKRAFDLMRSKAEEEKQSKWTWSVACPGNTIPWTARLFVEPIQEGYSYLELPAAEGAAGGGAAAAEGAEAGVATTYLVMPNRCANLVKHFAITERAASLESGATEPDWNHLRASTLVPLACGRERLPAQTTSMLGVSEFGVWFSKRRAVFLRRTTETQGDTDVFFHAIDGESVDTLWKDAPRLWSKLTEIGASIGATVATQKVDGVEKLDVEKRDVPIGSEAWDLQSRSAGAAAGVAGATPMHRRWGAGGKLYCLGGADPTRPTDGGANSSCEMDQSELVESLGLDGARSVRLLVKNVEGNVTAVGLPECAAEGQSPNWKSVLGLGEAKKDPLTWLDRMETVYRAADELGVASSLPCLVPRTCRVTVPAGTDLSRQLLVRPSLSSKSLLSTCSSQCKGSCTEVDLILAGDVNVGGSGSFSVEKDKLPDGVGAVRIHGNGSTTNSPAVTIRVAEVAANQPDGTYDGGKVLPAVSVVGGVEVSFSNLRFAAALGANGKPRTPAPALARSALEVSGVGGARPTVRLKEVDIDGGARGAEVVWPFYEGLRAKAATVYLHGSDARAYKRAILVEDTDLSFVGSEGTPAEVRSGVLTDVLATLYSLNLDGTGRPVSLAGTVKNFPALDLGARSVAFVAGADLVGPLAIAWGGSARVSSTGESAVFYDTRMGGGGPANPASMQPRALGMLINGAGILRFEKPRVSKTYMPVECTGANAERAPTLRLIQQAYSCIGTNQSEMVGASLCRIEQNANWERDEAWPSCVFE